MDYFEAKVTEKSYALETSFIKQKNVIDLNLMSLPKFQITKESNILADGVGTSSMHLQPGKFSISATQVFDPHFRGIQTSNDKKLKLDDKGKNKHIQ